MSSRALRVTACGQPERFTWGASRDEAETSFGSTGRPLVLSTPVAAVPDLAALEHEAFTKGYAQGERAGAEASAARAEAMLHRLAQTLDDLQRLRGDLIRRTEHEVVELALAIAKKVLLREVTLDRDLMLAMARVALDRLADVSTASIRLHPDDYAGVMLGRGPSAVTTHGVQIVADGSVRRGGCVVQSEVGSVDIGVAAQLDELTHALVGAEAPGVVLPVGLRDDAAA
jgi:flagellar assembly protein FliH